MPGLKESKITNLPFPELKSVKELEKLAEHPFDLAKSGQLTQERIQKYKAKGPYFTLLYGTERVTDDVMSALASLAIERNVVETMQRMQGGAILNKIEGYPSENRAALHTATRDFFDQLQQSPEAKKAAAQAKEEVDRLKNWISKIDQEGRFTDLLVIGIGGSELGPKAHYLALQHLLKPGRQVRFVGNMDPDDLAQQLVGLDLSRTLVLVLSKSGTTLETMTNEALLRNIYQKKGIDGNNHFIAITGQGSPMDDPKRYSQIFYLWNWVGGRFSVTSMIGGVMMAFAFGFDVFWNFLKGANAMDKVALKQDPFENLPLLTALIGIWNRNFLQYQTLAIIPYSQALSRFSAYLQQVDMESNGKRIDKEARPVDFHTGPIIWGEPGTSAQHSFYQLMHQGTDVIPVEFIGFKESQFGKDDVVKGTNSQEKLLANLIAQTIALAQGQQNVNPNKVFPGNRPSHILFAKQLTPETMGALLALYEHRIVFQGFLWGINSFDQEGVQLGKMLGNRIMDLYANKRSKSTSEPYVLGETFLNLFNES